jgi:hypothetical protein
MRKNHLPNLVGGNEQLVGENAIAFSCSEAGNFHLASGSQTFSNREEPGSLGLSPATDAVPPEVPREATTARTAPEVPYFQVFLL